MNILEAGVSFIFRMTLFPLVMGDVLVASAIQYWEDFLEEIKEER